MTHTHEKTSDLNIFMFLAELGFDNIKTNNQAMSTVVSKLNCEEQTYDLQMAQWKSDADEIGKDGAMGKVGGGWNVGGIVGGIIGGLLGVAGGPIGMALGFLIGYEIGTMLQNQITGSPSGGGNPFSGGGWHGNGTETMKHPDKFQRQVNKASQDQTKIQQSQQKMSSIQNIELNSLQENKQATQNMLNQFLKNFGNMASFNNRG